MLNRKAALLIACAVAVSAAIAFISITDSTNASTRVVTANGNVGSSNSSSPSHQKLKIVTSFFPYYDLTRHIAGDKATVSVMVPIGAEPHDWEPTIQQIQDLNSADMFVFNGAGIDRWADKINTKLKINTSDGLALLVDSSGQPDPHTWLDPIMAKQQVKLIRDGLIKVDPANADYYTQNAKEYSSQLDSLDLKIRSGLSNCNTTDFISFHRAFTYFAKEYGLNQHALLGEDPNGEIPPQTLQQMISLAKQHNIHVIYSEDLLDPRLAEVVAKSIPNGKNLVLSPVEGLKPDQQKAGLGYIDKMNTNLANLQEGLQCRQQHQ